VQVVDPIGDIEDALDVELLRSARRVMHWRCGGQEAQDEPTTLVSRFATSVQAAGERVARFNVHPRFGSHAGMPMLRNLTLQYPDAVWVGSMVYVRTGSTWPMVLHVLQDARVRFRFQVDGLVVGDEGLVGCHDVKIIRGADYTRFERSS